MSTTLYQLTEALRNAGWDASDPIHGMVFVTVVDDEVDELRITVEGEHEWVIGAYGRMVDEPVWMVDAPNDAALVVDALCHWSDWSGSASEEPTMAVKP
jgi:hypothetical protein